MEKHYFNMKVDSIDRNAIKEIEGKKKRTIFVNENDIPEGDNIKIFQGVFSQNFEKGEKSRNGYKYDQNGWFIDNYERLPIILWQHDDSYGGIGFTQEMWLDSNDNLAGLFYVDLDMLEDRHRKQTEKGFVKGISTGAITMEAMFEHNESGKRYTMDEAEDEFGWENVWKCLFGAKDSILTYVITKAELLENSLVTIGSNYGAIAKSVNSLGDEMKTIAEQMKSQKDKTLLSKNVDMSKIDDKKTETELLADANASLETKSQEIETLENKVSSLETELGASNDKVTSLENEVSEKNSQIEKLENQAKEDEEKINSLTKDKKEDILAKVKKDGENGDDSDDSETPKDINSFKEKYSKK